MSILDFVKNLPSIVNWRTSLAGVVMLAVGAASAAGVHVAGVDVTGDPLSLIVTGIGLIAAKDANK